MYKGQSIAILVAAAGLSGCLESRTSIEPAVASTATSVPYALRVKEDLARGRRWELRWDAAYAYDVASGKLERRVPLVGAIMAGAVESCRPDMLLDRSGALIVSSNAQPVVWRISPSRFEIERHDLVLDGEHGKDFGFSALAWGSDGRTLFAASSVTGTLWRIDLADGTANRVELSAPIRGACGLALDRSGAWPALVAAIPSSRMLHHIALSPDLRSAQVTTHRRTEFALVQ